MTMCLENRRILIVDDNPSIHADYQKILGAAGDDDSLLRAKAAILFGESNDTVVDTWFDVESAYQGDEGLERISAARRDGSPFSVAFVDIRMPPGLDGVETVERAWDLDPDLQFVICSAHSDFTASDMLARLGVSDRLLLLRKPCDAAEILLLATAMCHKWNLAQAAQV